MYDLIFNFINNVLINTTATGSTEVSALLTYTTIVLCFYCLIRLVVWAFYIPFNSWKVRR